MVCKENVVSWFSSLSSYKRIDVMCTLLNMCLPFEVRYLGTCVEDLGNRDYSVLRDTEDRANSITDLSEFTNLGMTDKRTRRKLALYTALLHTCNYSCAKVLYKILSKLDLQEVHSLTQGTNSIADEQPLEELLLLYTMALNHPAFNYEEKSTFGSIFLKLQEAEINLNGSETLSCKSQSSVNCIPCMNQNDRLDPEILTNCVVAAPPMQTFQGEMHVRSNPIIAGMTPGIALPPQGLCAIPGPEQMSMPPPATHPPGQYVHLTFPAVQPMQPWPGQLMMGHNQMTFQPHDSTVAFVPMSPSVSQQNSPSQSQVPSRSSSPNGHMQQRKNHSNNNNNSNSSNGSQQHQPRTSSHVTQSSSNVLTTSTSTSSTQTTSSTALGTAMSLPPLSVSTSRNPPGQPQQQPLMSSNVRPPFASMGGHQQWQHNNNVEPVSLTTNTATVASKQPQQLQPPPPPRLKPTMSGESLRESGNKDMPNFKGNFQNSSNNEIRRLSDEDISKSDLTSNVLNNIKTQTANGLTQTPEKKIEGSINMHSTNESIENEIMPTDNVASDNSIAKPPTIPDQPMMNYHHPSPAPIPNMRRYPHQMEPTHIQMFPPPAMYHTQTPCYQCSLTPIANIPNRYNRANHTTNPASLYCLANLQTLRLDPENNRNSQGSSSDSTGSRSPPETPPAVPWMGNEHNSVPVSATAEQQQQQQHQHQHQHHQHHQQQHMITVSLPLHSIPSSQERRPSRKNHNHMMRQKSHSSNMVNGVVPPPQQQQQQPQQAPPSVTGFQVPTATYVPHHFTGLRPAATGIYSNFTPTYARPGYPIAAAATYQHNGEMMYQFPTHPPPPGATVTGTPTPPTPATVQTTQPPPQQQTQNNFAHPPPPQQSQSNFVQLPPPTPQPTQTNFVPTPAQPAPVPFVPSHAPAHVPPKISCYNCGSTTHLAHDCNEQTMEDITKKAVYRLDYSTSKPTAGSVDQQSQGSDK